MFCKNCGKVLGSDDKFCAECGTRVIVEKKIAEPEPLFFLEKREEPVREKKAKRVIHLDEFNWDLDGYPTTPRKTEDVDFNWGSVIEEKVKKAAPKPIEQAEPLEDLGEMPQTVEDLLASLPNDVLEIVEEPEEAPSAEEAPPAEVMVEDIPQEEPASAEEIIEDIKTLEQIIEDFGDEPIEEPTRLIDKAQMKADSVDKFYVFSKKQAEYQNLLDQEYDRIQSSLIEKSEEEEPALLTVEEILGTEREAVQPNQEVDAVEAEVEAVEKEAAAEDVMEEAAVIPEAEKAPLELIAIMWSMPPAGILIESENPQSEAPQEEQPQEEELTDEKPAEEEQGETTVTTETIVVDRPVERSAATEADENTKEVISFADIFDDDEEEKQGGRGDGCLKAIAIALVILIIVELGILGIQYFAEDSTAAKYINQTYGKIADMITGSGTSLEDNDGAEEAAQPSEISLLIAAQASKNENIEEIVENPDLIFETDKDYGYEELDDTYAFKNSPWYETEDGKEITYGDKIIGLLIQYYSALPDMINDVNKDVFDYVEDTTALYEELESIEGDETRGYAVNCLEIGEIRTGQKGFYVMVNVTSADKLQPEQTQQKQLVYLEANPGKQEVKIKETKNI